MTQKKLSKSGTQARSLVITTAQEAPALLAAMEADARASQPVAVLLLEGAADTIGATCPVFSTFQAAMDARESVGFDEVFISLPTPFQKESERLSVQCSQHGLLVKRCPTPGQLWSGMSSSGREIRSDELATLIGRLPRPVDTGRLDGVLKGRRVLITGAGGSIGSELARISMAHKPAALVLMDRSENALFELDRELSARHASATHRVHLQDVVDEAGTMRALSHHKPDVVFHAAAHKHVPMMEDHPGQAVTNNLFGTLSVLDASIQAGVSSFVLVSTDKAVQPMSVMGATKRLAELLVMDRQRQADTQCSIVRFGNVLGSACSVLPIWGRQIAEGGPVTLTDARMTRYFMTIPEAASLVIQSASLGSAEADVFVLDMGEPVRILELAERFIRAHGMIPQRLTDAADTLLPGHMEIRHTGARPGEKLHEELSYSLESLRNTTVEGIRSLRSPVTENWDARNMLRELDESRRSASKEKVQQMLLKWVPGYRTQAVISVSDRVLSRAG